MELKLEDVGSKVAQVLDIGIDVIFRWRIEATIVAENWRLDSSEFGAHLPEATIPLRFIKFATEYSIAELVQGITKWQENNLGHRLLEELIDATLLVQSTIVGETNAFQMLGGHDRQRDDITDSLMEARIRCSTENSRLLLVLQVVLNVTQLVVHHVQIVSVQFGAHFDAHIAVLVEVPGRSVADNLTICGSCKNAQVPEGWRQCSHAQRLEELISEFKQLPHTVVLAQHLRLDIDERLLWVRCEQINDIIPRLAPHVAQQMHWYIALGRHHIWSVMLTQAIPYVAVDLPIEGKQGLEGIIQLSLEAGVFIEVQPVISVGAII